MNNTQTVSADSMPSIDQREMRKIRRKRARLPYLILAPAFVVTIGILYPFILAIYYSFTDFAFNKAKVDFVGIANYASMFSNPDFWHSLLITLEYAFVCTAVETVLGIGIAFLLNQENRLVKVMRVLLIFPLMIAPIIATIVWQLMTNPSVGVLSHYLNVLGVHNFKWGASPHWALFSVVLIDVWIYTPFIILLVLAGLKSLPIAPYEAALIDGGGTLFTFRNLTLPMLAPVIIIAAIFRLMVSLQEFAIIYGLTGGGPGNATMTLSLLAYEQGFLYMNMGQAITYMVLLWLVVFVLSQLLVSFWLKAQKRASGEI
ncbi:inner membrane ABC transporter permease protein YcjO [Peptococcaceae bacterium CEB3]|nr:inner membrane ABC transporter permease protein YcjO [Peptococcaceae bacterium CEB3]